jgi:ferritin
MLKDKIQEALNKQANAEFYSSYLYLSMSAYFQSVNLNGFSNWMRIQAQEELTHAIKVFDFINGRGGKVTLMTVKGPPTEWSTPLAVFEEAYKHEQYMTELINDLDKLATEKGDRATSIFLQWFITEQIEEEANANDVVQKLKLIDGAPNGLFMIDNELGQRTFQMPASTQSET